MANVLGATVIEIEGDYTKLEKDVASAKSKVQSAFRSIQKSAGGIAGQTRSLFTNAFGAIGKAAKVAFLGIGAGVAAVGAGMGKLFVDALPLEGIGDAFEGLTKDFEGGSDAMLKAMQEGSLGMVNQMDLMKSFNSAAQLVGIDFAQQLPDAMQYLSKVSAATGEDMGYMIDSIVRGVGRMSPMILDNLGIQVDMTAANEEYAESLGITVDEMTKSQQQTALMNQVMTKLKENTADMPEVAGTAMQKWEAFKTTMTDTKNEIGLKLIPVFMPLLETLGELARKYLPMVIDKVDAFLKPLQWMIEALLDAGLYSSEFQEALSAMVGDDAAAGIMNFLEKVKELATEARTFVQEILIPWVYEHWPQLKNVLIAVGAVLGGAMIVGGILSIASALATLFNPLTLIIAGLSLLVAAWLNDWGGIRTWTMEFWESTLKPMLTALWEWLGPKLNQALAWLKSTWIEVVWPALQTFWAWIQTTVFPLLQTLWEWLSINVPIALQFLSDTWTNVLWPAIQSVWEWMNGTLFPFLQTVADFLGAVFELAVTSLATAWEQVLKPALDAVWQVLQDNVFPWLEKVWEFIDGKVMPIISDLVGNYLEDLERGFNIVGDAIKWVTDKIRDLINWMKKINLEKIKDYLPGSLPPLALGFKLVSENMQPVIDDMKKLSNVELTASSAFNSSLQASGMTTSPSLPSKQNIGGGVGVEIHIHGDVGTKEDIDVLAFKLANYINQRRR